MASSRHPLWRVRSQRRARGDRSARRRYSQVSRLLVERLEPRQLLAGIQAFHQSGQTFITWQEDIAVAGETYQVYRHTTPITSANLNAAMLLTDRWGALAEGSSAYASERTWPSPWEPAPRQRNFIVQEDGPELSDTTGLFVWTTHDSGTYYYAVTTIRGGLEDRTLVAGQDATTVGLVETVAAPAPIRVHTTAAGRGFVYTQFMDYSEWNPTFEGYAYNYSVALPPGYAGSAAVPLMIYMQGWGGRYGVHDGAPYDFNSIWVEVDDPQQTWHYGFNADVDYRTATLPPTTGTIVNFTEQRILRAIDEVSQRYNVDENRIHGHGSSMGGSGMLSLGMRYPNVFAAVYAGLPMTDYAAADGSSDSTNWRSDLEPKWGTLAANLPIENRGPHDAHLTQYNGTGVWDWMDHPTEAVLRRGDETAYLCFAHTMQDDVIDWESQGQPFAAALYAADIGFQGADVPGGHSWPGFEGSNEVMIGGDTGGGWGQFQFRRDLSFPAISQASHAPLVPPPTSTTERYYYNQDIEWSVPWHDFGPAITDALTEYGITLRSTSGNQTADITPRRLQQFVVTPDAQYGWSNSNLTTSAVLQSGTATADAQGLLTIPGVQILAAGNRLRITSTDETPSIDFPTTADAIHVFSDQFPDDLSEALVQFIAGHYDGAQKMRTVFTDAVRAYNENFVMLQYRLAVGHGQHALLIDDDWASDWADVNAHEDWFLHAASDPARRLRQVDWDWNLMDIENPAWREYWLQSTIEQIRSVKAQGVFADSWDASAYHADVLDPWDARFAGTAPRDNGWTTALGELTQELVAGLSAAPEDFLYLPNLGGLVTGWDDTNYALADGGMVEGFGEWGAGLQGEASDWQLQMNRVRDLAGQDKVLLLQGTLRDEPNTAAGLQHRLFILGSYLLAKDDYTYINILPPDGDLGAYYYPEYEVPLGAATTSVATDVADLLWNGVYRRDFDQGFVLVNPTDTPREIALGGTFEMLVPSGGGAMTDDQIGAGGEYQGGSLAWVAVTQLTMPVASGAILRAAGPATPTQDIFFLHQSTGQGIMDDQGDHPGLVSQLQALGYNFGDYNLWDSPPGGSVPTEIATLFADSNHDGHFGDAFESVTALHGARDADILMLKSCFYTLAELEDPANLTLWEQAFIDSVAPYANQHPAQTLVVMPTVPLRAEAGLSAAAAARARDWAEWLAGDFITGYTTQGNVASFNLFDFWADAESHPTNANALQRQYCRTDDDHPNDAAYSAAADALTEFLTSSLGGDAWQNPASAWDVTGDADHRVTPLDALTLINYINSHPGVTSLPSAPAAPPPYYDVNGDDLITAADVLAVINYINSHTVGVGEGEATAPATSPPVVEALPFFATTLSAHLVRHRVGPARAPAGLDQALAGVDGILSELADDALHGWEPTVGKVRIER